MGEKIRVLWVDPVGPSDFHEQVKQVLESVKRNDVEIDVVGLSKGPSHLEYKSYEPLILVETLEKVVEAERKGYDAVIIGCFDDPGLQEARELVNIPVIGPGETCMHIACMLGHKFSIVTVKKEALARLEDHVFMYGLEKKLASFRFVNMRLKEMQEDPQKLHATLIQEAKKAIEEDDAEVIVLGCTVETGFMNKLIAELKVPIIDVTIVSFKFAEMMADLKRKTGLSHSKIWGYKTPRKEDMIIGVPSEG